MNTELGTLIHEKALACGYDNCGVIPVEAMDDYEERLRERVRKVPESAPFYRFEESFLRLSERYPWAKSVIVCTEYFGKYRFPASLQGMYAKSFLLSTAVPESPDRAGKADFEQWMTSEGIRYVGGETHMPGKLFPLRHAAVAAGLGIFRKNNFFYGPKGSWYGLEGYLIDRSCEYLQQADLKPCAEKCDLCRRGCPTGALKDAYTLNPFLCMSHLTTFGGGVIPDSLSPEQCGRWILGCDACQDACPHNRRHDWTEGEEFPGLDGLEELLQPENIISASAEELAGKVIPRAEYHLTAGQTDVLRKNAERVLSTREDKGEEK